MDKENKASDKVNEPVQVLMYISIPIGTPPRKRDIAEQKKDIQDILAGPQGMSHFSDFFSIVEKGKTVTARIEAAEELASDLCLAFGCAETFRKSQPTLCKYLSERLTHLISIEPNPSVRYRLIGGISYLKDSAAEATELILENSHDKNEWVRMNAALCLGEIAEPSNRVASRLLEMISDDKKKSARSGAARGIIRHCLMLTDEQIELLEKRRKSDRSEDIRRALALPVQKIRRFRGRSSGN